MKLESLQCNNCGADIEVTATTRFVTCAHCGGKLTVVRTESAVFTELAEKVSALSERMETHLERVERQNELERLDREWEMERDTYMVSGKNGRSLPSRTGSAIGGIIAVLFGSFWSIMVCGATGGFAGGGPAFPNHEPGIITVIFPAFGLIFVVLGLVSCFTAFAKADRYDAAKARYESRRRELLNSDENR